MRFNTIPLFVACMHCFIDIAQICVTILLKVPFDKKQHWLTPEADDIHGKTFRQKEDGVKHDATKHLQSIICAVVSSPEALDPVNGSVNAHAPTVLPDTIPGRYSFRISSEAYLSTVWPNKAVWT